MSAYYNEHDRKAAAWLRELIKAGHIAPGDVDERSIEVVEPKDLEHYTQCHFFAGIGVWSYALRAAGWPDSRPVWTGSCPRQPFSQAGAARGHQDERHLWPAWFRLIRERRPLTVFGEQVASLDGLAWLDVVCTDMEAEAYAVGALDTCAAGVGAPHIRQRLFFVADAAHADRRPGECPTEKGTRPDGERRRRSTGDRAYGHMADTGEHGPQGRILRREDPERGTIDGSARRDGAAFGMADADGTERRPLAVDRNHNIADARERHEGASRARERGATCDMGDTARRGFGEPRRASWETGRTTGPVNGFWRDAEWIPCIDGKARPTEPGTFPLAYGTPARVVRLRGYGNAINAEVAIAFIDAYLDTIGG